MTSRARPGASADGARPGALLRDAYMHMRGKRKGREQNDEVQRFFPVAIHVISSSTKGRGSRCWRRSQEKPLFLAFSHLKACESMFLGALLVEPFYFTPFGRKRLLKPLEKPCQIVTPRVLWLLINLPCHHTTS
jgi:hypothetical protein